MFNRAIKPAVWLAAALAAASAARAESLDDALRGRAADVLAFLHKAHCNNVGVLKFRVLDRKDEKDDDSGAVSLGVARRLAVALVLAEKSDKDDVGVVRDADAVAAGLRGANHLGPKDARLRLFEKSYPLAHGAASVTPDGFLTGEVEVGEDLHALTVHLQYLDHEAQLQPVFDVHADMDGASLIGLGYPFLTRRSFGDGTLKDDPTKLSPKTDAQQVQSAQEITTKRENILTGRDAPVKLTIFYGDEKIEPSLKEGTGQTPSIPDAPLGKKVLFSGSNRRRTPRGDTASYCS